MASHLVLYNSLIDFFFTKVPIFNSKMKGSYMNIINQRIESKTVENLGRIKHKRVEKIEHNGINMQ